jgi:hypothetical protein
MILHSGLEAAVYRARVDGVDPDSPWGKLLGNATHQPDLRVLSGNVGVNPRTAARARIGRCDDDAAALVHLRHCALCHEKRALHMDGVDRVEDVLGVRLDRRDRAEIAGIGKENVDFSSTQHCGLHASPD